MRKHPGALGCGSAGRVDRYGNGSEPISEQATEVAGNIGTSSGSQSDPRGTGMTGAPSSTNPQTGGGGAGYQTPRETPEAGGAPTTQNPNPNRR